MKPIRIEPLSPDTWPAFEQLFGPRGACGGCWCMTPRLRPKEYEKTKGEGNRRLMKDLVDSGETPGLLAIQEDTPIGWVSLGPRLSFGFLSRSKILAPVDDLPVWSVVCLFIAKAHRRSGISIKLLEAAADHASTQSASCLEGYPIAPKDHATVPAVFAYWGIAKAFASAGFTEVERRSPTRPIMRKFLRQDCR